MLPMNLAKQARKQPSMSASHEPDRPDALLAVEYDARTITEGHHRISHSIKSGRLAPVILALDGAGDENVFPVFALRHRIKCIRHWQDVAQGQVHDQIGAFGADFGEANPKARVIYAKGNPAQRRLVRQAYSSPGA